MASDRAAPPRLVEMLNDDPRKYQSRGEDRAYLEQQIDGKHHGEIAAHRRQESITDGNPTEADRGGNFSSRNGPRSAQPLE
jgi:hypothetical protein